MTIVDNPGFQESRVSEKLINLFIVKETMKRMKQVHFVLVIPYESQDDGSLIKEAICDFKNVFLEEFHPTISEHVSILLTKNEAEEELEYFKERVKDLKNSDDKEFQTAYEFIRLSLIHI